MESKGAISSTFPEKVRMDGQIFSEFALTSDLLISVTSLLGYSVAEPNRTQGFAI